MKNLIKKIKFLAVILTSIFFSNCKENLNYSKEIPTKEKNISLSDKKNISKVNKVHTKLYGIDISKWNGNEAEEIEPKDSITFVICKATQGIKLVDPDFKQNVALIRSKKLVLGTYHFFITYQNPVLQAQHYWNTIENHNQDLLPVIDIEDESLSKNKKLNNSKVIQQNLKNFLSEIEQKCNCLPMIYTSKSFASQYINNKFFSKYPLWLAEYTNAETPKIPLVWKEKGLLIWQKSESYTIHSQPTDFDVFYGKQEDLFINK